MKTPTPKSLAALLVLICCLFPLQAAAQVAIEGGTVHTVSGDVIEEGVVLVGANGLIEAVGKAGAVAIPGGYAKVDAKGKVVTPGLFDAYTSLGLVEIWAVKASRHTDSGPGKINAAHLASESFNRRSANIPIQRDGGVTDVVIIPEGGVIQGQAAHISLSDTSKAAFATILSPSVAMVVRVGARAASMLDTSRGGVFAKLRQGYQDARFYQKNKAKFDERRSRELSAPAGDLDALSKTFERGMPVIFLADRAGDIEAILTLTKAQNISPIIAGGAEAWMVRDQLAAAKVPVITNPLYNLPSNFEELGSRADNAALLQEAGVPVILSTFESHNVRKLRQIAGNAVRAGLEHDDALRAVTLTPATAMGAGKTHGSLEKGKVGNIVIWSGDPFEFSSQVEVMMIEGKPVSLEHRQKALLERYRKLERRGTPADQRSEDDSARGDDGE